MDVNGVIWQKRSSQSHMLQLLVPKLAREQLFLSYHAYLFGGHLGRNRTLARLAHRFYWSGMSDDVKEWLGHFTVCIKMKYPAGRHHPLGNIPTGHRWDRIAMDILDMCHQTPAGYRYILVIADYLDGGQWTEAFPIKNKCRRYGCGCASGKDHIASVMHWRSHMIMFGNHYIGLPPGVSDCTTLRL